MKATGGNRKMNLGKCLSWCQAAGKWGHASKAAAKRHLRRLETDGTGYEGNVYRCQSCARWHVGRTLWRVSRLRVGDGQ